MALHFVQRQIWDVKSLHKRDSRILELSVARPNITVRKYSEKKIEFIRSHAYISG